MVFMHVHRTNRSVDWTSAGPAKHQTDNFQMIASKTVYSQTDSISHVDNCLFHFFSASVGGGVWGRITLALAVRGNCNRKPVPMFSMEIGIQHIQTYIINHLMS